MQNAAWANGKWMLRNFHSILSTLTFKAVRLVRQRWLSRGPDLHCDEFTLPSKRYCTTEGKWSRRIVIHLLHYIHRVFEYRILFCGQNPSTWSPDSHVLQSQTRAHNARITQKALFRKMRKREAALEGGDGGRGPGLGAGPGGNTALHSIWHRLGFTIRYTPSTPRM